ncbi:hypothetical protein PFICI_13458 [Pestalotiopsis fici W106-1]|uniref:Peptidase C1A papain C-terminal domain-containing protein n=1 Tax=Pestalotiopsis fici (strain W106-1 / CGMCC3.15140) TaxID=1229662 RepID=W3WMI6_PESFW|nr:uncharacterized protein PFICI_13458 [Pestalotiopsis fici W106-1]ETS74974.1 hypothetical protein PFICI_13458 [Pestalotiopsis fici W106-1]
MAAVHDTIVAGAFQGWTPGFYDKNDRYYVPSKDVDVSKFKDFSLRSHDPMLGMTVYDQGALNSCVANANALAYWYELRKATNKTLEVDGPSRFFLWWNALEGDLTDGYAKRGPLQNTGTWNRHAMKILNRIGVCSDAMQHYPPSPAQTKMTKDQYSKFIQDTLAQKPEDKCYDQAETHKIGAYFRLDADRAIDTGRQSRSVDEMNAVGEICLDNVKRCLLDEHPVVLAFRFYWESIPWDKSTGEIWSLPNLWAGKDGQPPLVQSRHTPPAQNHGGHAVIAIGYDDKIQRILCQNSWGSGTRSFPSKGGLFWMPYDWVKDFAATNDFWTCRLEDSDNFKSMSEEEINQRVQNKIKEMTGH